MTKLYYYKIDRFPTFIGEIIKDKRSFELVETTYTRKIKYGNKTFIFNDTGTGDPDVLALINKVRRDAKNFHRTVGGINKVPQFDIFKLPEQEDIIEKVDIKAAYWQHGINISLISEDTQHFFNTRFNKYSSKYTKQARLKALGALATRKRIYKFANGEEIPDLREETQEDTVHIYTSIRRDIDNIIRSAMYNNPDSVYYYVDCLFMIKGAHAPEAYEYIRNNGFNVTTEETRLKPVIIGDVLYLESISDGKHYITRQTNRDVKFLKEQRYGK